MSCGHPGVLASLRHSSTPTTTRRVYVPSVGVKGGGDGDQRLPVQCHRIGEPQACASEYRHCHEWTGYARLDRKSVPGSYDAGCMCRYVCCCLAATLVCAPRIHRVHLREC